MKYDVKKHLVAFEFRDLGYLILFKPYYFFKYRQSTLKKRYLNIHSGCFL